METELDPTQTKIVYEYQFLQILRQRSLAGIRWIVRRLEFEVPDRIASEEQFDSLSEALGLVEEEVRAEEHYGICVDIPGLSEATKARLDGELPRLLCIDPSKLENPILK